LELFGVEGQVFAVRGEADIEFASVPRAISRLVGDTGGQLRER
jgi:hypothetical protein